MLCGGVTERERKGESKRERVKEKERVKVRKGRIRGSVVSHDFERLNYTEGREEVSKPKRANEPVHGREVTNL